MIQRHFNYFTLAACSPFKPLIRGRAALNLFYMAALTCCLSGVHLLAQEGLATDASEIQLVFLRMPNKQIRTIHAKSVAEKDNVLTVTDMEDKPGRYLADALIAKIPAFSEVTGQMKDEEIRALLAKYDIVATSEPDLKGELTLEKGKFLAVLAKRKEAKDAAEAQMQAAFNEFAKEEFKPAQNYSKEELNARIEAGQKLKEKYSALGTRIDGCLQPWVERAKLLAEGRVYFEGQWLKRDEIRNLLLKRRQESMKSFLDGNPKLTINSTAVSQGSLALAVGFLTVSVLICLSLIRHIFMESRGGINLLGFLTLLLSLGVPVAYVYCGLKLYAEPSTLTAYVKGQSAAKPAQAEEGTVVDACDRILYLAAEANSKRATHEDLQVILTDREINETLKKRLCFAQSEEVRFLKDRVVFMDQAGWMGRTWLFRYELFYRQERDRIEYYKCDVTVGKAMLPDQIANFLWRNYQQRLWDCLRKSGIPRIYQMEKIEDGKLSLRFHVQGN